MQRRLAVCLLMTSFLVPAFSSTNIAQAEDWPQWRGPNRNGVSSETNLNFDWKRKKPKLLWTATGLGNGYASVSIQGTRIFTTSNGQVSQAVVAINGKTGERAWVQKLTDNVPEHSYEGSRCTPTIDGDHLYAIASSGKITCLKMNNGEIVWEKDFISTWGGKMMSIWGFSESPLVDGDLVLCTPGGPDAMIVALDKLTGKEVWRSAAPQGKNGKNGAGYASIAISHAAGVKQYVQMAGRGAFGVRASDGELLWTYNRVANGTANIPDLVVIDDNIFCSTGYGTGAALLHLTADGNGVSAEEKYFLNGSKFQNHHGGMIFMDDHVYAGHGNNKGFPICLHVPSGKIKWGGRLRGEGKGSAATLYADGHLIYRYQSGEVVAIKANSDKYEVTGKFKPEIVNEPAWAHPVISNGKLYLRDQNDLMCYDLSK